MLVQHLPYVVAPGWNERFGQTPPTAPSKETLQRMASKVGMKVPDDAD